MTTTLSASAARTIVLTGSVAPYALALTEMLRGRGHAVHLVPSDRTDDVPSVFEAGPSSTAPCGCSTTPAGP